jgi:hypothetical protein
MQRADVESEWKRVASSGKSLFAFYQKDRAAYQRWYGRFVKHGLLHPKRRKDPPDKATYARAWRKKNPEKATSHVATYWAKKFASLLGDRVVTGSSLITELSKVYAPLQAKPAKPRKRKRPSGAA